MAQLKPVNLIAKGAIKRPFFKKLKYLSKQKRKLLTVVLFVFLLVLFLTAAPAFILNNYRQNASSLKLQVESTKKKFKKVQSQDFQLEKMKVELTKKEAGLKQRMALLSSTLSKEKGYSYLLLSITGLLPADVWVNRFVMNDNEIQISGSSVSSQLIAEFMNKLEANKDIKNTRFISSEKQLIGTRALYNFQIATEPWWVPDKPAPTTEAKEKENNNKDKITDTGKNNKSQKKGNSSVLGRVSSSLRATEGSEAI